MSGRHSGPTSQPHVLQPRQIFCRRQKRLSFGAVSDTIVVVTTTRQSDNWHVVGKPTKLFHHSTVEQAPLRQRRLALHAPTLADFNTVASFYLPESAGVAALAAREAHSYIYHRIYGLQPWKGRCCSTWSRLIRSKCVTFKTLNVAKIYVRFKLIFLTYFNSIVQWWYEYTQWEINRGLSIIMLGLRGTFGGFSVFMVGLYSTT